MGAPLKKSLILLNFALTINKNKIDTINDNNPLFEPEAITAVNMANVINIKTIF